MGKKKTGSLFRQHPLRVDVPVLILAAATLLYLGLSMPVMKTEKLIFWHDQYTIINAVQSFIKEGNIAIGLLILFFSIIFPALKLASLVVVWFVDFSSKVRMKIIEWLEILGRWSMLDVFVAAIFVIMARSSWFAKATPQTGLYVFGLSILLSMIVTFMVKHLAKPKTQS